jgi:hypothetical protein
MRSDKRIMASVLAFVGAACLITAAFSKSWMGNPNFSGLVRDRDGNASAEQGRYLKFHGDIRFGPLGFEQCAKPYRGFEMQETPSQVECRSLSLVDYNDEIGEAARGDREKYTSEAFARAGWLAFAACLLSAAGLLVSAGLVLARKKLEVSISPASVTLLGLLGLMVAGCVFIATKPGPGGMVGVDLGFWAFGAGTVIGILGAQLMAKELRPADPDLLAAEAMPDDFSAFAMGRAVQAQAPVPAPLPGVAVPPTQPVEALAAEPAAEPRSEDAAADSPGDSPGDTPGDTPGDSPGDAKKPDEVSS